MQKNKSLTQSMFDLMKEGPFDLNSNLKWGFSFYHKKEQNLKQVYEILKDQNYILEHLEHVEKGKWHLYITQIGIFTVDSLEERNDYLNAIADRYKVEYDGWDVERI